MLPYVFRSFSYYCKNLQVIPFPLVGVFCLKQLSVNLPDEEHLIALSSQNMFYRLVTQVVLS